MTDSDPSELPRYMHSRYSYNSRPGSGAVFPLPHGLCLAKTYRTCSQVGPSGLLSSLFRTLVFCRTARWLSLPEQLVAPLGLQRTETELFQTRR
jgi:hypothetical protein